MHSDQNLMPKRLNAWSSWNAISNKDASKTCVTYWLNKLQNLNVDTNYVNFTDYIHLKNNTVWAIKWKRGEILREIHLKIKIFSEPNYLLQDYSYLSDGVLQISIKCAITKKKLKYLNESPIDEIYDDYISYINDNKEIMRSLVIDNYGEGNYFPHLMGY